MNGETQNNSFTNSDHNLLSYFNDNIVNNFIINSNDQRLYLDSGTDDIHLFGNDIYHGDQLNSNLLAQIIFNDADALKQVNAIIHPKVRNSFTDYADQQDSQYVFNEAAILIESGGYKQMDTVVLISAPVELRISRVMLRDACTEDEVTERISKQWADNQKRKYCDFEIVNANNLALLGQVESLIEGLKK